MAGADGKVLRKEVIATNTYGHDWIVTGGLVAGDQVIASGLQSTHEGAQVRATPWEASGQNAALLKTASNCGSRQPS